MEKLLMMAALGLLLAACGTSQRQTLGSGHPAVRSPTATIAGQNAPLYCYRSLGDVDCFARARPESAGRLVGKYDPTVR